MKRTLLLILAALLSCAALSAQDKIYFIDSRVVDALVDEVGEDMVYYRAFAFRVNGINCRCSNSHC